MVSSLWGRGAWRGETKLNETEDAGSVGRSRSEKGMATTKVPVALFRSDRRVWGSESSETEIIVVLSATWKKQKKEWHRLFFESVDIRRIGY